MEFGAKADVASAFAGLDRLSGEMATHLARSMAVAGGKVLRDEAKLLAPVGGDMSVTARLPGESNRPGTLRDAIYLAYREGPSVSGNVVYSVSWNSKKAPHGHLVEFGHWQTNVAYIGEDGEWHTDTNRKLSAPKWIPAHPFLRPALDSAGQRAVDAMIARGRERLAELLSNPSPQHADE